MKKLNLDQLEDELEVINADQLYCIKGGYGDYGGYSSQFNYDPFSAGTYDPLSGTYDPLSGSAYATTAAPSWDSIVTAAQNGTLASGLYTNEDYGYSYAPPINASVDPSVDIIGGSGDIYGTSGNDCVFDCLSYANSQLGGNVAWNDPTMYATLYDMSYGIQGQSSNDGVNASLISYFTNSSSMNLTTFNVDISQINGLVPAGEVIMTDIFVGANAGHEEILKGIFNGNALLIDPQNNNRASVVSVNDIACTNLIGFNAAH